MKRFLAISLLLLIGMITTVAASPPGFDYHQLNQIGLSADMPDDVAAAPAAIEQLSFIDLPDVVSRAGCKQDVKHYYNADPLVTNLNQTLAEINRNLRYSKNRIVSVRPGLNNWNRYVCGLARSWVLPGDCSLSGINNKPPILLV